jgi:hypothetical protein
MQVYFDTNVYRLVRARDEVFRMQELLRDYDCTLTASSGNLFETLAISTRTERLAELQTLVTVAHAFERYPESWLHAAELRAELRRRRPSWMRTVRFTRREREFLKHHADQWERARRLEVPPPHAYARYRRDAEAGTLNQREFQKVLRDRFLENEISFSLLSPEGQIEDLDVSDPELFWRLDGLMVWFNAIEGRSPASRDYADWLDPYLKRGSFRDPSYRSFWLKDASAEALPLNRLTGLVSFYQLGTSGLTETRLISFTPATGYDRTSS